MADHTHRSGGSAELHKWLRGNAAELAHFVIDHRVFRILPADNPAVRVHGQERCRFVICGLEFVILEEPAAPPATADARNLVRRLSGRELEIAVLVAQGLATKNIAYRLQISEWTVSTYMRRIFAKLNVESRAAMVYRCADEIKHLLAVSLDGD